VNIHTTTLYDDKGVRGAALSRPGWHRCHERGCGQLSVSLDRAGRPPTPRAAGGTATRRGHVPDTFSRGVPWETFETVFRPVLHPIEFGGTLLNSAATSGRRVWRLLRDGHLTATNATLPTDEILPPCRRIADAPPRCSRFRDRRRTTHNGGSVSGPGAVSSSPGLPELYRGSKPARLWAGVRRVLPSRDPATRDVFEHPTHVERSAHVAPAAHDQGFSRGTIKIMEAKRSRPGPKAWRWCASVVPPSRVPDEPAAAFTFPNARVVP